MLISKI